MNELYMPAPTRNAAALTVQTPRMRIIVMSTSGSAARSSLRTQSDEQDGGRERTGRSSAGSPQPQSEPSLMATQQAHQPARQQRRAEPS